MEDVTVRWTKPIQNTDGSAIPATGTGSITNSTIQWSTSAIFATVAGSQTFAAGVTSAVVSLAPGTYYFRVTVKNSYGVSSAPSNIGSITLLAPPTPEPPVLTSP